MPIPKGFLKSPYEINHPDHRWKPDLDFSGESDLGYYAPFVQEIRKKIYDWRQFGYPDVSNTSRYLLKYWFSTEHANNFKYYFGQRESIESVIYLFEKVKVRSGGDLLKFDSWGLSKNFLNDQWVRLVLKQATGTGKTKVLMLVIAWAYFHKKNEKDSLLSQNFLLIAPNTIVLDRLKNDIMGLKVLMMIL